MGPHWSDGWRDGRGQTDVDMSRPRALIFDYTGVITVPLPMSSDAATASTASTAEEDATPSQLLQTMMRHELHNPDPDGLWNRLERGEAPLAELLVRIDDVAPGASVFFAAGGAASLMAALTVRPDVIARLSRWRHQGVPLALLTNNVKEWRPLWTANLEAAGGLSLFDVIVDSSEIGMRKPEARIYTHTVEALAMAVGTPLAPTDCLFVDDFAQNIEGAAVVGLPGLLATHDDEHWTTLDRILAS